MANDGGKRAQTVKAFEAMIAAGRFKPGARIPSERALLKDFDVSYMTLRAAMLELVKRGVIVRRGQLGSFLSPNALSIVGRKKIHFIYKAWEGPFFAELLQCAARAIEGAGFLPSVMHFQEEFGCEIAFALEKGDAAIIFGVSPESLTPLLAAAAKGSAPVVVIGCDVHLEGTCGIKCDDAKAMSLAIERLRLAGHSSAILFTHEEYLSGPQYERLRPWFECANAGASQETRASLLLAAPDGSSIYDDRALAESRLGEAVKEARAAICSDHGLLVALLSACHRLGLKIPEDLSVITLGDTSSSDFLTPPVTGVSADLQTHMEEAVRAIVACFKRGSFPQARIFVAPKLIERESVKSLAG